MIQQHLSFQFHSHSKMMHNPKIWLMKKKVRCEKSQLLLYGFEKAQQPVTWVQQEVKKVGPAHTHPAHTKKNCQCLVTLRNVTLWHHALVSAARNPGTGLSHFPSHETCSQFKIAWTSDLPYHPTPNEDQLMNQQKQRGVGRTIKQCRTHKEEIIFPNICFQRIYFSLGIFESVFILDSCGICLFVVRAMDLAITDIAGVVG